MSILDRLFIGPLKNVFEGLMLFLPRIMTSLLILAVGIVLAGCLNIVLQRVFRALRAETLFERLGIADLLKRGGVRKDLSTLLARFFGWLAFFVFALSAIDTLQITAAARLFEDFLFYLPQFFAALFILLIGYLVSNFVYRTVLIAAVNAENRFAKYISRAVKYVVMLISITMAIEQLGIGRGTVAIAFSIIFGGVVLACAIAFGFGGKEIARTYLESRFRKEDGKRKEKDDDGISHI